MSNSNLASGYWPRVVDRELDELTASLPAVCLEGPRGIGKTTTALQRATEVFELDDPHTLSVVAADPERIVRAAGTVVVDEWQRMPYTWDLVRRSVDENPQPGRFILTGSASPATPPTHSGAGRIVSVRMRPLSLCERRDAPLFSSPTVSLAEMLSGKRPTVAGRTRVRLDDYVGEILNGGFPGLRSLNGRALRAALAGFVSRIAERDFPDSGRAVRNPGALRRWMAAYSAATATAASYEKIRDAATSGQGDKPSRRSTGPYIDILEQLYVLDPLPGWSPSLNRLGRLTEGPKHHLADPALAAFLLEVDAETLLRGSPESPNALREGTLLGALFESLAALSLRVYAQHAEAAVGHLRTWGGKREIDLIVSGRGGKAVAVEVKLAQAIADVDVRHLRWLRGEIGAELADAAILTTGREADR
ncbi:MAG: DUF4143 domain-containing protein, partial [bacterium]|nr:DUF4143 domain-containing protein [bacterium]